MGLNLAKLIIVFLLPIAIGTRSEIFSQQFLNLDFEYQAKIGGIPSSWHVVRQGLCEYDINNGTAYSGNFSLLILPSNDQVTCRSTLLTELNGELFKGKTNIQIEARVLDHSKNDSIRLLCKQLSIIGQEIEQPFTYEVHTSDPQGWSKHVFTQAVASKTEYLAVGFNTEVNDLIRIDDFKILIDNVPIQDLKSPPRASVPGKDNISWLNENIIDISNYDDSSERNSLHKLEEYFSTAEIVGLGEVTHGSSEIFKLKQSLVEFLTTNQEFNVLAIEMSMPEAHVLNEYIQSGRGNSKKLLETTSYLIYKTAEFLELIEWMRSFNNTYNKKIKITGIDIPMFESRLLSLKEIENSTLRDDNTFLTCIEDIGRLIKSRTDYQNNEHIELINKLNELSLYLEKNKQKFHTKIPATEYLWLEQNVRLLKQSIIYESLQGAQSRHYRDSVMARNLRWIRETNRDSRIILWGHNGHIKKTGRSMGHYISENYGSDYYTIGFALGNGTFNAVGVNDRGINDRIFKEHQLESPVLNSYESFFINSASPTWFLDLNLKQRNASNEWLFKKLKFRFVGAGATHYQFDYTNLTDDFDGLIYINSSTATKLFTDE